LIGYEHKVYAALSRVYFWGIPLRKETPKWRVLYRITQQLLHFRCRNPPSKKETPIWRVLYRITRQLLHFRCGSFSQEIETANNPAQLS
jgi:hypothetical protein